MIKNKGLGRGLGAILDVENVDESAVAPNRLEQIDIEYVSANPNQPRTIFDQEALEELADSITTLGLIQPITVKRHGAEYIIISGERRWRASKLAGLTTIPAYILDVDDQAMHEMALVENIQRQDLNAIEIAVSLQRLIEECGITQETVAQRVGKKRSTVANYLRLLSMPPELQAALKAEQITMGHAKAVSSVNGATKQLHLLHRVLKKGLSVRATEALAKKMNEEQQDKQPLPDVELPYTYTRLVESLSTLLTEDISIRPAGNGKGKIVIGFQSDQQIENLLARVEQLIAER